MSELPPLEPTRLLRHDVVLDPTEVDLRGKDLVEYIQNHGALYSKYWRIYETAMRDYKMMKDKAEALEASTSLTLRQQHPEYAPQHIRALVTTDKDVQLMKKELIEYRFDKGATKQFLNSMQIALVLSHSWYEG